MTFNLLTSTPASTVFFGVFIVVTFAALGIKCWLATRQIHSVLTHRAQVPADFVGHVSLSSHERAADYTVAQQRFSMLETLWNTLVLLAWTVLGGLNALNQVVQPIAGNGLWYGIALILFFFLINGILELPWSLWSTFKLEHRFGFNTMTFSLWVKDLITSVVLGFIIGVPLLALILWLMVAAGHLWWLWAWMAFAIWQLLLMVLFPVVIAPLFNKFKPLDDETLLSRVSSLMQRCGFKAKGFFVMDGSKRSAHSNAYFTGMGKSKRVVFYDTLLHKLTADQMEAVLAHELGHFHYKHITRRIVVIMAMSLAAFALLGWISQQHWFYAGLGVQMNAQGSNSALALLLFMIAGPVFLYFISPLAAQFSRRDEFQADAYACKQASGIDLRAALLRLYEDNASTLTPDPVYARFYYSHPPASERLAHLQSYA